MTTDPATLYVVDGYALIYRAFFAMISRPLRTSRGENTSAVWGVANFLHRLFDEHGPGHVVWVHDSGTSFRTEVFPDYKATREKLDDELQEDFDRSVERVQALLAAFRLPLLEVEGYEADDVIGTLAARAAERGVPVTIVSGDKDFYQLISPGVSLLNPGRGGPAAVDEQLVDESNAAERLGVPPERVVDYLALVGDASDNIPGVKGIGDKTARKLIEEFGSLDRILEHAKDVPGKRAREALVEHAEEARLSRDLVTIRRAVPLEFELDRFRAGPPDVARLRQLYAELEFHSLLPKLESTGPAVVETGAFTVVDDPAAFERVLGEIRRAEVVALDTETTSLEPMRAALVGLSLAVGPSRAWYFPFGHRPADGELIERTVPRNLPPLTSSAVTPLRAFLEDASRPKAGHNIKFDWHVLGRAGVQLRGARFDTMLASFVLDPGRRSHGLDVLALDHLQLQLRRYADVVGKGKQERPFAEVPVERAAAYCCEDSVAVLRLREFFLPQLDAWGGRRLLDDIELPLVEVLADMERRGVALDTDGLSELSEQFRGELEALEAAIYREAGTEFNINSTPQLRHVLFDKLNLPVQKRTKTGASTDADVLSELAAMGFELPRLLLEYRELAKLKSTYVDVLPLSVHRETGRVHTSFNQTGASTGRLSSSDPNLQNIPVRTRRGELIRRCFVAAEGCRLIVADYSQIELRLLAHLSEDPRFIEAFGRGGDIHRETAAVIFDVAPADVTPEMRARAKTINFATIYGQGPFALSRQLGIDQRDARDFIRLYFERFAGVRRYLDDTVERARREGYVETIFGRRRYIPELRDNTYNIRAFGERVAMNSPLQGSAADLIKFAMIRLYRAFADQGRASAMVLQVHDELVVEAPAAEADAASAIVRREMEGVATLKVPLVVEVGVGANWLDAKT